MVHFSFDVIHDQRFFYDLVVRFLYVLLDSLVICNYLLKVVHFLYGGHPPHRIHGVASPLRDLILKPRPNDVLLIVFKVVKQLLAELVHPFLG